MSCGIQAISTHAFASVNLTEWFSIELFKL